MTDFFRARVKAYKPDTGKTLRKVDTQHAPKVDTATFDKNLETEGELDATQCASHLMGSLYGARMAHPGVSVAVTRLAAHITKWKKECDRRLERFSRILIPIVILCSVAVCRRKTPQTSC